MGIEVCSFVKISPPDCFIYLSFQSVLVLQYKEIIHMCLLRLSKTWV